MLPAATGGEVEWCVYSEEGARFVFDKEKLEAAKSAYKYEYFNGTSVVEKTATVSLTEQSCTSTARKLLRL